jgi:alpha-tubulin suppressor-like RCC1 family protein
VAWGGNEFGVLGVGHTEEVIGPVIVVEVGEGMEEGGEGGLRVKEVACGWAHCLALMEDDSLYVWGANHTYQLGKECAQEKPKKLDISEFISGGKKVAGIGAGFDFSFLVVDDGTLIIWGQVGSGVSEFFGNTILTTPRVFPSMKFQVPEVHKEKWEKILRWVFLGNLDEISAFFEFPKEVIFHFLLAIM